MVEEERPSCIKLPNTSVKFAILDSPYTFNKEMLNCLIGDHGRQLLGCTPSLRLLKPEGQGAEEGLPAEAVRHRQFVIIAKIGADGMLADGAV